MMSSRVLSRLLPVAEGDVSSIRRAAYDIEAGVNRTSNEGFHDQDADDDPERMFLDGTNPQESRAYVDVTSSAQASPSLDRMRSKRPLDQLSPRIDEDEDVPESLVLDQKGYSRAHQGALRQPATYGKVDLREGSSQDQPSVVPLLPRQPGLGVFTEDTVKTQFAPPKIEPNISEAAATWTFTNSNNLDAFLLEVYRYYVDHGVWSILLSRTISLLTEIFVFSLTMFMTTCVDYARIPESKKSSDVVVDKCMAKASWTKNAMVFFFVVYVLWQAWRLATDIPRLFRMHDFYRHVLRINDQDIQTVSWVRVVEGLVKVQNANVATAAQSKPVRDWLGYGKLQQPLNAETIANRLMRQDNYYVALYNKDVLDFSLPLPFLGSRQFYSKSLEWCIDFCLTNFIFDEQGNIRPFCLDIKNRRTLVNTMQMRLQFAALTSVLIAPFNIARFCLLFFLRYYTEFTRNPASLNARSFTPFAEWKIREFNELQHLFERRLRQACPFANDYLKQFPKHKTDQLCRFVALVSGGIAAVLGLLTLWDHELFLGFEVTPGRTAVFWLTVMLGVFGVAHGMLPDENEVHDPVLHLKEVLMFTHYLPAHWKERLHSNEVREEFASMYQMKVMIFAEEILSLVVAPWILLRNATSRSERLVDFFREQTVHVEGIGNQCNFAVFGFKKNMRVEDPTAVLNEPDGLRDDYYGVKDDKMAASVQNFMQYYSHYNHRPGSRRVAGWQPPPVWPPIMPSHLKQGRERNPGAQGFPSSVSARHGSHAHRPQRRAVPPLHSSHARVTSVVVSPTLPQTRTGMLADLNTISPSVQDSELKGFAGASVAGSDEQGDKHDGVDDTEDDGDNAGVLGMLYQFSKARTERGTGINI